MLLISCGKNDTQNEVFPTLGGEWIKIPENSEKMGLGTFYVMKYEAKAYNSQTQLLHPLGKDVDSSTHYPYSSPESLPWREISADIAFNECKSLGDGYALITNEQWMAIARSIENINANWTGNQVGYGKLFKGNNGEPSPIGDGTNIGDTAGYLHVDSDPDADNLDSGISRDLRAKFVIDSGDEIYDLSGNVWEWIDWDDSDNAFTPPPSGCTEKNIDLNLVNCPSLVAKDFLPEEITFDNQNQAIGKFYGGDKDAAIRGGRSGMDTGSGLYTLFLDFNKTSQSSTVGFRCVYVPTVNL